MTVIRYHNYYGHNFLQQRFGSYSVIKWVNILPVNIFTNAYGIVDHIYYNHDIGGYISIKKLNNWRPICESLSSNLPLI
jgi:hypothetical protein